MIGEKDQANFIIVFSKGTIEISFLIHFITSSNRAHFKRQSKTKNHHPDRTRSFKFKWYNSACTYGPPCIQKSSSTEIQWKI